MIIKTNTPLYTTRARYNTITSDTAGIRDIFFLLIPRLVSPRFQYLVYGDELVVGAVLVHLGARTLILVVLFRLFRDEDEVLKVLLWVTRLPPVGHDVRALSRCHDDGVDLSE